MAERLPNRLTLARLVPKVADNRAVSAVLLASLVIALAGCDLFALPPPERNPSVVGVIESSENMTGVWHYELENGESLDIDFDKTETLPESTGGGPGALLFYGGGDDAWFFTLREPTRARMATGSTRLHGTTTPTSSSRTVSAFRRQPTSTAVAGHRTAATTAQPSPALPRSASTDGAR